MISIFGKIFLRLSDVKLRLLNKTVRQELGKIREELDEHLQAINENTNEISTNFGYIGAIEGKLDRLSERLDQIHHYLEAKTGITVRRKDFNVKKLNRREQDVFLAIYTLEEEKGSLAYEDIAKSLKISEQLAANYVACLIEKGVPIIKRYVNSKPRLNLDPEFKTLQAKENILQLSLQEFGF